MKKHLLLTITAFFSFCVGAWAQSTILLSGQCGNSLTYEMEKEGNPGSYIYTLTIKGTGPMYDYEITTIEDSEGDPWEITNAPWKQCYTPNDERQWRVIIEDGVTTIGKCAFLGLDYIISITLPNSITSIGDQAFEYCSSLFREDEIKKLVLPTNLKTIGERAFYDAGAAYIRSIEFPSTLTSIGDEAFLGFYDLNQVICKAKTAPTIGTRTFGSSFETTKYPDATLLYPKGSNYDTWKTYFGTSKENQFTLYYTIDGYVYDQQEYEYGAIINPIENPTKQNYTFSGWDGLPEVMPANDVTVTGKFNAILYTISYRRESGTLYQTQNYMCGVTINPPSVPTKTGYIGEWKDLPKTMPAENLDIYPKYTINSYTITYMVDGKQYGDVQTYEYGANVTAPTPPTKTGYTFAGWDKTIPSTMPAENMTIKAQWTVNQYTITFDTDGGSAISAIKQNYGTSVTKPANPTKTGYTFAGWDKAVPSTMPAGDMTIKAKWTINQYTITFDTDGGSAVNPIKQNYNTAVTAPANPTKTGYTFDGWDKNIPSTMPAENVTITAKWKVNQYTIQFNSNGGSTVSYITQDYGTKITAPANPTRTGYTFAGWNPALPETMPAETKTHTAQWTINQYTITFDTDGGSAVNPIKQDYGTAVTTPSAPTKTGYTFAGWDKVVPTTMPAEDVTIKAKWTINKYTITFDTDGGSAVNPINADYGTAVSAPTNPTKEGYTFKGWSPELPKNMPAENKTHTAQWKINQYTITFDADGGSTVNPINADYGTAVTAPTNPTKEGYTFKGWSPELPKNMPAENKTHTAQWTINQYTITFDTDGGTEIAPITQDYGTAVTAPAAPTKTGYTFAGWDAEVPATMPAENVTITAKWTINQYTITFDTDGGSEIAAITQDYNTNVKTPADPTKEGYTFTGWDKQIPETMPAEDMTIKAQWAIGQYSITFDTDGGTAVNSIVQDYGTAVAAPADPTKEGYTFAGWKPAVPATMPEGGLTVKAQWTVNQYTITFDVDGGSAIDPITQNYGTAVTAPAAPTKTGYTFAGWEPALPTTMPAENMTVTAQWTINQYTITFNTDGGSTVDPIIQDYGTDVTAPADPTKTGYTFAGWDVEIPATMPAENITIKAQWTYTPTIEDGKEYTATENMLAETLTYTRTLPNTGWNALYVPFEIPVSMLSNYEVAYMNDVRSYDMDDDGVIDDMSMEIIKIKSGTLNANYPYLIKAKDESAQKMEIRLTNVTVYAAAETTVDCSSVIATFAIKGTYTKIDGTNLNGCYALSGGIWKPVASDSYLNPSRIYLTVTEREGSPVKVSTETMQRVRIHVKGEENTTSVEEKLLMDQSKEDIIYDLMGRRVLEPQKSSIYIVNGKKIVF